VIKIIGTSNGVAHALLSFSVVCGLFQTVDERRRGSAATGDCGAWPRQLVGNRKRPQSWTQCEIFQKRHQRQMPPYERQISHETLPQIDSSSTSSSSSNTYNNANNNNNNNSTINMRETLF